MKTKFQRRLTSASSTLSVAAVTKIHVCLVSDQILANLIPALMERPDKVALACSAKMSDKKIDSRLKKLLEREGIAVDLYGDAPDTDLSTIQEFAFELADKIEKGHPGAEIVLNATGGTKLMALGFVEMFRGIARRIIYTDTDHRRIETLPDDKTAAHAATPMTDVLDVPRYLAAQGLAYRRAASDDTHWCGRAASRKAAAKYLACHAHKLDSFIGAMNRLADLAFAKSDQLTEPRQAFEYAPHPRSDWAGALRELSRAGLLGWSEDSAEIVFIDTERTQFLRGGWLEEYAWHILRDENVFDARLGIEIASDHAGLTKNELDVLATHGNQLLFVECKTLRFNPDENDNELAYKLDSLGKTARGLFGATWLLSARAPTPQLIERLRSARIRLVGPDELPRLREAVQGWMHDTA
ncbi:MAG: DUF1887 family CARF protein [Sulfuritalea sp.]|nr:DUF1887 family CARF protein [Sulfuritalea sp.]